MVNYKDLRLNNLNSPQFKHLLLLLYWPIFGLLFWLAERGLNMDYNSVECSLDAKIPFCELFVIPYYFWFAFLFGIHIYTLLIDIPAFKKLMYFIIMSYTVTIIIYLVYPTQQNLRPQDFTRDNIFIDIIRLLYGFDTNTNVCPSLHVIGSFAILFTSWHCKQLKTFWWRFGFLISTLLISISTVFMKQHSIIDVWVALIVCFVCYPFAYIIPDKIFKKGNNPVNVKVNTAKETQTIS